MTDSRIALLADHFEDSWEAVFGGPFIDYASNEPESARRDLQLLVKELEERCGLSLEWDG